MITKKQIEQAFENMELALNRELKQYANKRGEYNPHIRDIIDYAENMSDYEFDIVEMAGDFGFRTNTLITANKELKADICLAVFERHHEFYIEVSYDEYPELDMVERIDAIDRTIAEAFETLKPKLNDACLCVSPF